MLLGTFFMSASCNLRKKAYIGSMRNELKSALRSIIEIRLGSLNPAKLVFYPGGESSKILAGSVVYQKSTIAYDYKFYGIVLFRNYLIGLNIISNRTDNE
jgi:hypothetical protein